MPEQEIGTIEHFFGHIPAATIKLTKPLKIGETLHIKGHTTDFEVKIGQLQIDHKDVTEAKPGVIVGIKVPEKCREHDKVFKIF